MSVSKVRPRRVLRVDGIPRSAVHDPVYITLVLGLGGLRVKAKLTQAQLAAKLKKPQSYIAKIENFNRRLDVIEFARIAYALGLNPDKVIDEAFKDAAIVARQNRKWDAEHRKTKASKR